MKKYEFTGETKTVPFLFKDVTLHRIQAITSFANVVAGELGGWIEKEENLSHKGDAWVSGNAEVSENAVVRGNAWVRGNAVVSENAEVFSVRHVLAIGPIGSRNAFTTFYRDKDNEIAVKCGCFRGKIDKFLEKVTQTHCDSKYALVYRAAVEVARLQIAL